MGNKDEGFPLSFQFTKNFKEMVYLLVGKSRGRLVQYKKLCVHIQGAANLQQLLLAGFKLGNHGRGINVHAQIFKKLSCSFDLLLLLEKTELIGDLPAKEDIVGNGQVVDNIEFLMHKGYACRLHLCDAGAGIVLSVKVNAAAVSGDDAGEDIHQGRLTCTVFTQQSMNLAFLNGKVNFAQGLGAAKCLGNVFHLKDRHNTVSLFCIGVSFLSCGCR